jgi:hypothetical protein
MMVSQGLWSNSKYDRVDEEIGRMTTELGEGLGGAQSTRGGIDLRDVTLEDGDNAFAKMMRLSAHPTPQMNSLRETLLKVITSKSYAIAVDGEAGVSGTKLNMIAGVISKYRETAYKKVLADSPILRTAITKRQRETGLAIRENMRNMKNQPEGDNPIQNAIDLLGAQ